MTPPVATSVRALLHLFALLFRSTRITPTWIKQLSPAKLLVDGTMPGEIRPTCYLLINRNLLVSQLDSIFGLCRRLTHPKATNNIVCFSSQLEDFTQTQTWWNQSWHHNQTRGRGSLTLVGTFSTASGVPQVCVSRCRFRSLVHPNGRGFPPCGGNRRCVPLIFLSGPLLIVI